MICLRCDVNPDVSLCQFSHSTGRSAGCTLVWSFCIFWQSRNNVSFLPDPCRGGGRRKARLKRARPSPGRSATHAATIHANEHAEMRLNLLQRMVLVMSAMLANRLSA